MKKIVILIYLLTLPSIHALGADFYVIDFAPKAALPDQTVLLNITLKNLGDDPAAFLKAILDPSDTTLLNPVGPAKKYLSVAGKATRSTEYFGVVSQGSEIFLQYPVHIDENASVGTYGVPLKLLWQNTSSKESTQTLELGITVVGEPKLVISGVSTLPSRIYADSEFNISVKMENIGTGKAEAVELTLTLPGEFTGEKTGYLGTVKRDTTSTATFNLKASKNTPSKAYDFTLKITYQDADGTPSIIQKGFEVYLGERGDIDVEIAGVTTSPSKIYPGEDFSLSVQLENIGKQDAKSVRAEIAPLDEFIGERIAFVGSLKEDDLSTAIFEMSVAKNAKPRSHELKMTVFYTDEKGVEYSDEKRFMIRVSQKPRSALKTVAGGGLAALVIAGLYFWRRNKIKVE